MSFVLQSYDGIKPAPNTSVKFREKAFSSASTFLSSRVKELTIEETEVPGADNVVSRLFEDSRALKLSLLFNQLCNTWSWQDLRSVALRPYQFDVNDLGKQYESARSLRLIRSRVNRLLGFMKPAIEVNIGSYKINGGATDVSVQIRTINEEQQRLFEYTSVAKIDRPCMVYRAANYLVFGHEPSNEDYNSLKAALQPSTAATVEMASKQLQLNQQHGPLKHFFFKNGEGKMVKGYTRGSEDVTKSLLDCHLKQPLDAFHRGVLDAVRHACLNHFRHVAVSDGFTFIGAHLSDLKEPQKDLLAASFDSHYAVDMTETGSSLKMIQYFINAAFECKAVRCYIQVLITAAHECFQGEEITVDRASEFKELANGLQYYEPDEFAIIEGNGLEEGEKIFVKQQTILLASGLTHFRREYGAIARHVYYERDSYYVAEYYREYQNQGLSPDDPVAPGRCLAVFKADLIDEGRPEPDAENSKTEYIGVVKQYDADEASLIRMERELRAYRRIALLDQRYQKHFAKLLAFGAIETLFIVSPCLITEFLEDSPDDAPGRKELLEKYSYLDDAPYPEREEEEINKVYDILESVGVYHNDLCRRNYRWKQDDDGEWYIKVFDFDHATFKQRT